MRTDSPFDSLVAADLDQLLNAATQEAIELHVPEESTAQRWHIQIEL